MPPGNKKGGKKHKRGKKGYDETKILRTKEEGQEYAQIISCKGGCRFDVRCCDGTDRLATLCGGMRKRRFVNMKDIVLVSLRDFQDSKCDIIDVYDENQSRKLKDIGQIPEEFKIEEDNEYLNLDDEIDFVNDMPTEYSDESDGGIDLDEI
jgi:translation initiation factor 1A